MLERVRAERVIVGSFFHEPGERAAVTEWWPEPSIVFTSHGAWEVRARRGRGDVTPDTVLVNEPVAEHDCLHPHGLGDRMLCVLFREDADAGPALLVPLFRRCTRCAGPGSCMCSATWPASPRTGTSSSCGPATPRGCFAAAGRRLPPGQHDADVVKDHILYSPGSRLGHRALAHAPSTVEVSMGYSP